MQCAVAVDGLLSQLCVVADGQYIYIYIRYRIDEENTIHVHIKFYIYSVDGQKQSSTDKLAGWLAGWPDRGGQETARDCKREKRLQARKGASWGRLV